MKSEKKESNFIVQSPTTIVLAAIISGTLMSVIFCLLTLICDICFHPILIEQAFYFIKLYISAFHGFIYGIVFGTCIYLNIKRISGLILIIFGILSFIYLLILSNNFYNIFIYYSVNIILSVLYILIGLVFMCFHKLFESTHFRGDGKR